MRTLGWAVAAVGLNCLMAWVVFGPLFTKNPITLFLIVAVFLAANIGTIWMLYVSIRSEKHPFPFILLAFIPYAFLWYYFERVRPGKHRTQERTA